jgi:CRISPR-associated protein Cmr3
MFEYLIAIEPLGFLYGSAGAFLSPENLVGRSGAKFPPDTVTLSGLYYTPESAVARADLAELFLAGPFWGRTTEDLEDFYVPLPWTKVVADEGTDEWQVVNGGWFRSEERAELKPERKWQRINTWNLSAQRLREGQNTAKVPWQFVPMLHPHMRPNERHALDEKGLFLENAVQMEPQSCLVYLASHRLRDGLYRFGGEGHIVEVTCHSLSNRLKKRFQEPIGQAFSLITPGVWGSNRFSHRAPQHPDFPELRLLLTEKPNPYRYRLQGRLSRGRYAVPAGSVYVLDRPLNRPWSAWPEDWFPREGRSYKRWGCGLALPLDISGLPTLQGVG